MKRILAFTLVLLLCLPAVAKRKKQPTLPTPQAVENLICDVNRQWQSSHPLIPASEARYVANRDKDWTFRPYSNNSPFWDNAAYHTGNMEVCKLSDSLRAEFLPYSLTWAEAAQWEGATGTVPEEWKYSYGEKPQFALFGDWQICFQTYADLYKLQPEARKIARARRVMEYEMSTSANDYWWWADGLYMVMPVMVKLYNITENPMYLHKLYEYWTYAKNLMYDKEEHLFYRDGKYIYPKHKSANGKKDFWARGCGWVVAGLAKVLDESPDGSEKFKGVTWSGREDFLQTYLELCAAVKACQQPEGYWTRSLLDPEHAPGPETSGTAFYTYGLLWGINHGLLSREEYLPTVLKAWDYLTKVALQEDHTVGYVQPIGERAIPGQTVDQKSTANFGVGAFLLCACEMYRLCR